MRLIEFPTLVLSLLLSTLLPSGCGGGGGRTAEIYAEFVSIGFTVTDFEGYAFEGVEIRILDAWQERDGHWYQAQGSSCRGFTDRWGRFVFGPADLAASVLGFYETLEGEALLTEDPTEDQALVRVRIGASSLGFVKVEVPLSYLKPHNEVVVQF